MALFTLHGEHCAAGEVRRSVLTVSSAVYQSRAVAKVLTRLESRLRQSRQCCADWSAELSATPFPARALIGRRPRSLILCHIPSCLFSLAASSCMSEFSSSRRTSLYVYGYCTAQRSAICPVNWPIHRLADIASEAIRSCP
jgi:hypothetical protein